MGEFAIDSFQMRSLDPLSYDPVKVSIKNLKVESLLKLLKRPGKSPMFGNLGYFSGSAVIRSPEDLELSGEHAGLEFVFANKGQSEVQKVSRIVGDVSFKDEKWNFSVQRAQPQDGSFVGDLKVQADRDFKDVKLAANVEELTFSPVVQKLMTNGGDFGPLTFDADAQLKEGRLGSLKGLLQVSQMNVEGLFVLKSKFQFKLVPDWLAFQYSNRNMVMDPHSPAMGLLSDVVKVVGLNPVEALKIDQFQGDFKLTKNQDFSWTQTRGRLNGASNFVMNGAWNSQGQLRGQLQVQDRKRQEKWTLQGTRDLPILSPQTGSRRRSQK